MFLHHTHSIECIYGRGRFGEDTVYECRISSSYIFLIFAFKFFAQFFTEFTNVLKKMQLFYYDLWRWLTKRARYYPSIGHLTIVQTSWESKHGGGTEGRVLPKFKFCCCSVFFLNDVVSLKCPYPLFFTLEDPSLFRGALNKVGTRRMKLRFYQTSNAGLVTRLIVTNVFKMFFADMKEFSLYWLRTEMEFHS